MEGSSQSLDSSDGSTDSVEVTDPIKMVEPVLEALETCFKKYSVEARAPTALLTTIAEILAERSAFLSDFSPAGVISKIRTLYGRPAAEVPESEQTSLNRGMEEIMEALARDEDTRLLISTSITESNATGHLVFGTNNRNEYLESMNIYLDDEISKSFMVSVADTTFELLQRVIGKTTCLRKDLSRGYDLWEIPFNAPHKSVKIGMQQCPVVLKRAWQRPTKIYFLTTDEANARFGGTQGPPSASSTPKLSRNADSPSLSKKSSRSGSSRTMGSDSSSSSTSNVAVSSISSNSSSTTSSSPSLKVYCQDGPYVTLIISKNDTGDSLKRRAQVKFGNVLDDTTSYSLYLQIDNPNGSTDDSDGSGSAGDSTSAGSRSGSVEKTALKGLVPISDEEDITSMIAKLEGSFKVLMIGDSAQRRRKKPKTTPNLKRRSSEEGKFEAGDSVVIAERRAASHTVFTSPYASPTSDFVMRGSTHPTGRRASFSVSPVGVFSMTTPDFVVATPRSIGEAEEDSAEADGSLDTPPSTKSEPGASSVTSSTSTIMGSSSSPPPAAAPASATSPVQSSKSPKPTRDSPSRASRSPKHNSGQAAPRKRRERSRSPEPRKKVSHTVYSEARTFGLTLSEDKEMSASPGRRHTLAGPSSTPAEDPKLRQQRAIDIIHSTGHRSNVSLHGIGLTQVPEELNTLPKHPKVLDLSFNKLDGLPSWFSTSYSNILGLNLSNNMMLNLEQVFLLAKIRTLDLSGNRLESFPSELVTMNSLRRLYLNFNQLTEIPKDISRLIHLKELAIAGNNISELPSTMSRLTRLELLDASLNKVKNLKFIRNLTNLAELYLASTEVEDITQFYELSNLTILDLSGSLVTKVPHNICGMTSLVELKLSGNPIGGASEVAVSDLEVLPQLTQTTWPSGLEYIASKLAQMKTASPRLIVPIVLGAPSDDGVLLTDRSGPLSDRSHEPSSGQSSSDNGMSGSTAGSPSAAPALRSSKSHNPVSPSNAASATSPEDRLSPPLASPNRLSASGFKERTPGSSSTGLKRRKYSQRRFSTLSDVKRSSKPSTLIDPTQTEGFNLEFGRASLAFNENSFSPANLRIAHGLDEYFTNFYDQNHWNFLAVDKDMGVVIISIMLEAESMQGEPVHRVLIKSQISDRTLWLPAELLRNQKKGKLLSPEKFIDFVVEHQTGILHLVSIKHLVDPAISKEILDYESRMCYNAFKFGVLYAGMGSTEDDFYSNTNPSQEFHNFLEFLGDMIRLQGWPHFTGGLDVTHNRTGRLSIYKRWASLEIMFHVSTFLPYAVDDPQQIERKKHIGNDVVVIIFQDEGAPPFSPAMMKSYFNHVYVVIRPIHLSHDEVKYTLAVCSKNGVQEHTPFLPEPTLFDLNADFRRFLYTKLVNAERSSYEAPNFSKALCRTRLALLQEFSSVHSANTLNKKIRVKSHKQK